MSTQYKKIGRDGIKRRKRFITHNSLSAMELAILLNESNEKIKVLEAEKKEIQKFSDIYKDWCFERQRFINCKEEEYERKKKDYQDGMTRIIEQERSINKMQTERIKQLYGELNLLKKRKREDCGEGNVNKRQKN